MSATATERKKAKSPQLLTEIERQKAVLAELPDKYEFPLFDGHFVATHAPLAPVTRALPMTSLTAVGILMATDSLTL